MGLRSQDLQGLLACVSDAYEASSPDALTTESLDRLTELFDCAYATYQAFDWPRRTVSAYVICSNEDPLAVPPPYVPDTFWTDTDRMDRRWPVERWSDRLARHERERIRDEEEFNAEFRIVDSIKLRVGDRATQSAVLNIDSQGRDFNERDRELAVALHPHVEGFWHRSVSRSQVAELVAALERDDDAGGRAILLHAADGRIDHATAEAQRVLATWFATRNGRIPHELDEWLAHARPGDRYVKRRNGSMLTVEATGAFTLRFDEYESDPTGLTARQREVLGLVAEGLGNAEIARRLWLAPSTVAKHLERAYSKLGVHSRTAAIARLAKLSN